MGYDREILKPEVLRAQRRVTLMGDAAHPMTPFKAQGANQALMDAVLLAETLASNVAAHGSAGIDLAIPIFEEKMLQRSARMVIGSREKAKELHSSLALQPARKVQRETEGCMHKAIATLRSRGIGAHSARHLKGLDAVVADSISGATKDREVNWLL